MKNSRRIILLVTAAGLLWITEILIDRMWGDGDGKISQYGIHRALLFIEFILCAMAGWLFINRLYVRYFRNKSGAEKAGQLAGRLLVMMVSLVVILIPAEILSRLFFPSAGTFDRIYPVENARYPHPYSMFKGRPGTPSGFGSELYNLHGYRGKFPVFARAEDEYRILVLGGSAVWEGDTTLTEFLESYLRKNGKPAASVYNMGVVSANSSMQLVTLLREALPLKPDAVIFYDGANDFIHPLHYDPRPGYPFNFLVYENNPFFKKNYPVWLLIAYKSNLFRWLAKDFLTERITGLKSLRQSVGYGSGEWRKRIADVYLSNHLRAYEICRSTGAEFFSVLQPMVYFKKYPSPEEREYIRPRREEKEHSTLMLRQYHLISDKLPADCKMDLTGVFSESHDSIRLFTDNVHLTNAGRKRIAEKLGERLLAKTIHTDKHHETGRQRAAVTDIPLHHD